MLILILLVILGVAGGLAVWHICHRLSVLAEEVFELGARHDLESLARMAGGLKAVLGDRQ